MDDKKISQIPPYVSFKTFYNFIEPFKLAMPSRIDRSLMKSHSGAQQNQLIGAFKSLGLMTDEGRPTDKLIRLVKSEGQERQKALKDILVGGYPFLFRDGRDLTAATQRQLDDAFSACGISGDTIRKCVSFFIAAAKYAELPLSPYLKTTRTRSSSPRVKKAQPSGSLGGKEDVVGGSPAAETMGWHQMLLAKFPSFDPNWDSQVQAKWFDGFEKLMRKEEEREEE